MEWLQTPPVWTELAVVGGDTSPGAACSSPFNAWEQLGPRVQHPGWLPCPLHRVGGRAARRLGGCPCAGSAEHPVQDERAAGRRSVGAVAPCRWGTLRAPRDAVGLSFLPPGSGAFPSALLPGFKCPICSKSVASDEMEMHFIMCLSKPRLSYNGKGCGGHSVLPARGRGERAGGAVCSVPRGLCSSCSLSPLFSLGTLHSTALLLTTACCAQRGRAIPVSCPAGGRAGGAKPSSVGSVVMRLAPGRDTTPVSHQCPLLPSRRRADQGRRRVRDLPGGAAAGGHDSQAALPLHLSQKVCRHRELWWPGGRDSPVLCTAWR